MGLSSKYPYYGPLGSGNYNVSLAFFGPLSEASKSIGLNSSTGLVLPNTDYIQKFAEGDLGISDSFIKNMLVKNMNSPIASKNEAVFKQFAKQNKIDVSNIDEFKKGDKFVIPKDKIKIPDEFSMTGFKAFEKTTLQSIFDTQKPFMEIVGVAIGSVAKAEDVIARVMPFFGNPLTVKSRKPVGNGGSGNARPKAIGFKGAAETKQKLQKLNSIQASTKPKENKPQNAASSNPNDVGLDIKNQNTNTSGFPSQYWKVLSTVYSTGEFEPTIDYKYTYINLPADEPLPEVDPLEITDTDPFDPYKPKTMIFGIYNSKGEALDPNEYLKTIGLKGNDRTEEVTPFKRADWILRSKKWKLPQGMIEWPNFGTPNYVWKQQTLFGGVSTRVSKKSPGANYSIKRYKAGDTNILTGNPAIPNDPIIQSFDAIESESHKKYYNDLIDIGLNGTKDLSKEEKVQINKDINGRLDIKPQIELSYLYGHTKASIYNKVNNKVAFPEDMKKSYKPFEVFIPEAAKDPELAKLAVQRGSKAGMIWIDPEADYDMKVIRVDPVTSIEYLDAVGEPEIKTSIRKFVKNRVKFSFSNGATFSLSISKNGADTQTFDKISDYTFENWNYEDNKIKNTNTFDISVWSDLAPAKFTKNFYQWRVNKEPKKIFGIDGTSTTQTEPPDYYSITKVDGTWRYSSTADNYIKNGVNYLGDTNAAIYSEDGKITRWYYIYDEKFKGPNTQFNLPAFGIERSISINYEKDTIDVTDKTIPIWRLKIDDRFSNSKIIDPTKVTNDFLTTADLFAKDPLWYGHGSPDDPQTLGIIKRYALTDLDEESYYIVEGILKNDNEFDTDDDGKRKNAGRGKGGGGGWYRLPHAIGAIGVFIRLLIDIGVKLLPKISKLMALFQNPAKFVTDIMSEKLTKNFEFLSSEAISTFQQAGKLKSKIVDKDINIENIKQNIDAIRIDANALSKRLVNDSQGKSEVEQSQTKKKVEDIKNKTEEKIAKLQRVVDKKKEAVAKLRDHFKNSILSNYVYVDDTNLQTIFTLDGAATIPLSVFGAKLNFGIAMNMGNVPTKPPLKLIFPDSKNIFKNVQYLIDNAKPTAKNTNQPLSTITKQEIADLKTPVQNQLSALDKQPPFKNKTINFNEDVDKVQIKFEDGSVEYIPKDSLQTFVLTNQNKYNFIYVTEEINKTFVDVDNLLQSGTQEDLDIAKEKLDDAKKNFPNNSTIDDKLKELSDKNESFAKNLQPLLKAILGLTTFPIKVVADIIKWMFDFFASLTNPMTLASKMKEFLSFQWILQYFTPTGILAIFGLKFAPLTLIPYAAMAASATGKAVGGIASMVNSSVVGGVASKVGNAVGGVASKVGNAVGGVASNVGNAVGDVASNVGNAVGDVASNVGNAVGDVASNVGTAVGGVASNVGNAVGGVASKVSDKISAGIADLSKYISINMIPKLPSYTADQYKNLLKGVQPTRLLVIFQMMQKFINGVIDFIWSLLGIEALIKAPHIKIVPEDTTSMSPEDIKKILDGIEPSGATSSNGNNIPNPITGSNTNAIDSLNPAIQGFMYEVKLPDGTTKTFLDRDQLDLFIEQNKEFDFDFTF